MSTALPPPEPNGDSLPYWNAAREGRLLIRRCKACGRSHFMPRAQCPHCWSDQLEWVQASGHGRIHSFTIMHRAPTPAFAATTPYVLALVDLAEGPRMCANVVGAGALEVGLGDEVKVTFEDRGDGWCVPQFTRAGG